MFVKRCAQDLSVAELKRALLEGYEKVLNKLFYFAAPIPATRQNLRYKTHQAVSFIRWLKSSSYDKLMCFAATTQTEASSLGMLGEWFWGPCSPSMSILLNWYYEAKKFSVMRVLTLSLSLYDIRTGKQVNLLKGGKYKKKLGSTGLESRETHTQSKRVSLKY